MTCVDCAILHAWRLLTCPAYVQHLLGSELHGVSCLALFLTSSNRDIFGDWGKLTIKL